MTEWDPHQRIWPWRGMFTSKAGSQGSTTEVRRLGSEGEECMSGMFDYVKFDDTREVKQATLKAHIEAFWRVVEANLPPGPERTKAQNKLQEAWMWVGKALKAEQLAGDGRLAPPLQPPTGASSLEAQPTNVAQHPKVGGGQ